MKDKKKWMMAAAAATGALIGRICYECRHFTTEYYDVASDKIPEAKPDEKPYKKTEVKSDKKPAVKPEEN